MTSFVMFQNLADVTNISKGTDANHIDIDFAFDFLRNCWLNLASESPDHFAFNLPLENHGPNRILRNHGFNYHAFFVNKNNDPNNTVPRSRNYMRCRATYVIPGPKNRPKLPPGNPPGTAPQKPTNRQNYITFFCD